MGVKVNGKESICSRLLELGKVTVEKILRIRFRERISKSLFRELQLKHNKV